MPPSQTIFVPDNRLNSSGPPPKTGSRRASNIVTTSIAAGATFTIPNPGSKFYLIVATLPVMIRPRGGIFNSYSQGTGLKEDDSPFDMLEVYNNNPLSVGISLFVGWGDYIDNRLIPINSLIQQVTYPTYDANAAPLNNVAIPDLSGQYISDANGVLRIALQRVALQIFNIDTGQAILLLNNALTVNVANVPPLTGITLPTAGNFRIKPPVATVNGIVSEIYSAILPSQIQSS